MDDWYQGGILQPEEENENTGDLVINFLHRKHTVELILDENLTKEYDKTLTMLHLYITSEVIECVAMSGGEDPGVMYGIQIHLYIIFHNDERTYTREAYAYMEYWKEKILHPGMSTDLW